MALIIADRVMETSTTTGTGPMAIGGDPYFSSVSLLVGSNGSVVDESSYAATITLAGSATASATAKFGSGSLDVSAAGAIATVPDAAKWPTGSDRFTIECWVNFASDNTFSPQHLVCQYDTSANRSWSLQRNGTSKCLQLVLSNDGTNITTIAGADNSWVVTTGVWYYVAADFDGTTYRIYQATAGDANTVLRGSSTTLVSLFNSASVASLGSGKNGAGISKNFNGYLDEVRVTKGVARYNSDLGYTVPSSAFPRAAPAAAIPGFRAFSAVCAVGDTCYYTIEAVDTDGVPTGEWETGLGTYSAVDTLTRTLVTASSNAGAAVSFAAGTKRVFINATSAFLATRSTTGIMLPLSVGQVLN